MITLNVDPILLGFGHLAIRWYGLIVVSAVGLGVWVSSREARRRGISAEDFSDLVTWVIIGGLLGARLFHVIDHWPDEYAANPLRMLYIWEGGLAIWGGVAGGLVSLDLFAARRSLALGLLTDMAAPGLALGQGLGRIACLITGDAIGKPTAGPLGIAYANPNALVPQLGVFYTPTPLYEMVMNLVIFAVLWRIRRKPLPGGALFLIYLLLYSTGRFAITFWSSYKIVAFGLNQAQIISLAAFAIAVPLLGYLLRPKRWKRVPA
jgi:phosphatidylglycerol:prolipoprotein diacylglycerol transferase